MEKKISSLRCQKNNPDRINVFIEGSFSFSVDRLTGAWLRVGQTMDDQRIGEIKSKGENEKAYQSAIHFMSFRNRSTAEVQANLHNKGYDEKLISDTIERLKANGILDDRIFAQEWVENRVMVKPRGRRLLEYELKQKKVNPDEIHRVLESLPDEVTLALKVGEKRMRQLERLDRFEFGKKLFSFLQRKGFNYEVSKEAINRLWEEKTEKQVSN